MLRSLGIISLVLLNKAAGRLLSRTGSRAMLALAIFGGPALALSLSGATREWVWSSLGYGFVPAGLWIAALLPTLWLRRHTVTQRYGLWLASALIVVASLAVMSIFFPSQGVLEETGLSGTWGSILGGEPVALGLLKAVAVLCLVPFAVAPRRTVTAYRSAAAVLYRRSRFMGESVSHRVDTVAKRLRPAPAAVTVEDLAVEEAPRPSLPSRLAGKMPRVRRAKPIPEATMVEELPPEGLDEEDPFQAVREDKVIKVSKWRLPGIDLLSKGEAQTVPQATLDEIAINIETTLSDHGVEVSVKDIKTGPRVIRFGLVPGWVKRYRDTRNGGAEDGTPPGMARVKVHSIVARERDLALSLKTSDLRIESPVPGEALVGLEVPSPLPSRVFLRTLAESSAFKQMAGRGGLPLALGQGTGGEPVTVDLVELPHLLIAGATGSGKSVCINSIITSLMLAVRPDRLRMLMVDPKRVELTPYNGIPHLMAPVIVDGDQVPTVLDGLLREMFRRYRLLEEAGVRNIDGYHSKSKEAMPYLLLVIDELADLMIAGGFEVEQSLVRLAQLGRATGIHLILCTQRPSVNVVTGLLKANVAARIAFAVASQVDSRVVLDGGGADKLLGKGDMLFLSAQSPKPRRIQGTYVSDAEIQRIIDFWNSQKGPALPEISLEPPEVDEEAEDELDEDDLLDRARELADRYHHISASLLQRRLQLGYPRAMRLIDMLEDEGYISSGEPGRSRKVIGSRTSSLVD